MAQVRHVAIAIVVIHAATPVVTAQMQIVAITVY